MCMSILKQTETDWVLPLSRCVTKGGELASPIKQWSWSGWRGSSTCSRIKAAGPSSGWRGLRQAGGRGSSENSVYVAFLKSRRSFTGLGEHHWWKYMHWDHVGKITKKRPKQASCSHHQGKNADDDQETHVVWIGEGDGLSRDVCWPSDKRIVISPRWAHTFTHFGRSTF